MAPIQRVWFTSDLHLGHARIVELCNRPFTSVEHMNEEIIERWNGHVAPGDTVYILGDLAMGKLDDSLQLVARLQGQKILVPGNHDRVWSGYNKKGVRDLDVQRYQDVGLTIAEETVRYFDDHWTLCHFPDVGDSLEGAERYAAWRPPTPGPGELLVHGHVHTAWKYNGPRVNVGVDVWDFFPVSEYQLYAHWSWGCATSQDYMSDE